jgi:hypothetical protein
MAAELLRNRRELTIDPHRNYQPQQGAQIGHYHLRQTGTMT